MGRLGDGSIYELNALARKLGGLDEEQTAAFEGLLAMESGKSELLSLARLLDLAYSGDCCHVVGEALNDSQLGRFYAENGFVPEAENLPDKTFELLDFERIGREMRKAEGGVFTSRGYVTQHSEPEEGVVKTLELTPKKPPYAVLLEVSVYHSDVSVQLELPAQPEQMNRVPGELGAESWQDLAFRCSDCRVPALRDAFSMAESIAQAGAAAEALAQIPERELPKYKALVGAMQITELDAALELTRCLDDYALVPEESSYKDVALGELTVILGEEEREMLLPYVNLYQYGEALAEHHHIALTDYGGLDRKDGQPLMADQQEQSLPTMGGMELV